MKIKRKDDKKIKAYYSSVLTKHGFTREQFEETILFYSESPKRYEKIYDKVLVELSKIEGNIKSKEKKEGSSK